MTGRAKRWYAVFTFDSTHDALDAERRLLEAGLDVTPIPAPPSLSANCGIALRVQLERTSEAESVLADAGIRVSAQNRMEDH